jgi:hypothetical protein
MSAPFTQPSVVASADVLRCRVIGYDGPSSGVTLTASTNEPLGISNNWTFYPPGTAADSPAGLIAPSGQPIPYIGNGRKAFAYVASAVTGGTRVQASTAGGIAPFSVAAGATGWSVGMAEDSAPAGSYVEVFVDILKVTTPV